MKKKSLITLLFILSFGIHSTLSQTPEPIYTGPKEVLQFNHAVYTVIRYEKPSQADVIYSPLEYGFIHDFQKENLGHNIVKRTSTIIFDKEGTFTIFGGYTVKVKPNPIKLDYPSHICPYGTQLITNEISPYIQSSYTITGDNTSAKISDTGILTYDPNTGGTIKVKLEQKYTNGGAIYKYIEKYIYLNSHDLIGTYYQSDQRGNVVTENIFDRMHWMELEPNLETSVKFDYPLINLTWKSTPSNVKNLSFDPLTNILSFTPTSGGNVSFIRFDLEYQRYTCPVKQRFIAIFELVNNYNVSYASNKITIKREGELFKEKNISLEHFTIVDLTTGSIKSQGSLTIEKINQIDASSLPKGIYTVHISNGRTTKNYNIYKK